MSPWSWPGPLISWSAAMSEAPPSTIAHHCSTLPPLPSWTQTCERGAQRTLPSLLGLCFVCSSDEGVEDTLEKQRLGTCCRDAVMHPNETGIVEMDRCGGHCQSVAEAFVTSASG